MFKLQTGYSPFFISIFAFLTLALTLMGCGDVSMVRNNDGVIAPLEADQETFKALSILSGFVHDDVVDPIFLTLNSFHPVESRTGNRNNIARTHYLKAAFNIHIQSLQEETLEVTQYHGGGYSDDVTHSVGYHH